MLLDDKNMFSREQAITATAVSTDTIDLGVAGRAPGNPLQVVSQVTELFTLLTSLEFQVQSSNDPAFGSFVTHQKVLHTLASGKLAAGQRIDLGELLDGTLRYVRINYVVAGTAPNAGRVTTALVPFGSQTLVGQA